MSALWLAGRVLALYWALLFAMQRWILFPAPTASPRPPRPADTQVVWLESAAGRTEAWYLPAHGAPSGAAPLLIYAHGNAELIEYWADALADVRSRGVGVLLVEYPGYGRSGGAPSSRSIQAACEAAFDWARAQPQIDGARIILHGRSLGGGAMAGLSRTRPAAALVLESTFTDTAPLALRFGAPPFLVRDRFDVLGAVKAFRGPVLVLHGERDEVIPVSHGRRLADAAGVPLLERPCGHNDCTPAWPLVLAFLDRHGLLEAEGRER